MDTPATTNNNPPTTRNDRVIVATAALCLILSAVWAIYNLQPRATPYSAEHRARLWEDVRHIAAAPHPLGTAEHDRVRDYIVQTLSARGFTPRVQQVTSVFNAHELYRMAEIQNILVRVPGKVPGHALLVVAHYDSAPVSRGAADDGAAFACMLELAGDLRQEAAPDNDIIFLFSDGEEWGSLGARGFLSDPWAKQVAAVLNLDARGTAGRPALLQTAGNDDRLISLLQQSRAPLWAASYVSAGFHASGNDTDFTVFQAQHWSGYNVAFFDKPENYHTPHDDPERLDQNTLQELDVVTQRLTRTLANTDLSELNLDHSAAFASLPGDILLRLPLSFVKPISVVLFLFAVIMTIARIRPSSRVVASLLTRALLGVATAVSLVGFLNLQLYKAVGDQMRWRQHDGFLLAALLAAGSITLAVLSWTPKAWKDASQATSIACLVLLLSFAGCIVTFVLPEGAFLLLIPAFLGCILLTAPRTLQLAPLLVPVAAFFWIQTIWQLATGLGVRAQWLVLFLATLIALASCLTMLRSNQSRRLWATALLAIAMVSGMFAKATHKVDSNFPLEDHLISVTDISEQSEQWFTFDDKLDPWNGFYIVNAHQTNLGSFLGGQTFPGYASVRTYSPPTKASTLSLLSVVGNQATLQLTAQPETNALRIDLYTRKAIPAVALNNTTLNLESTQNSVPGQARLTLVYLNPPKTPVLLQLSLSDPHALEVTVVDVTFGLNATLRPPDIIASPQGPTDGTLVRQHYKFIDTH